MNVTAKVAVTGKTEPVDGQVTLTFNADYANPANKEWAKYTPALSLQMSVLESVAEHFTRGQPFTLTFTPEEN
jgi:hypothetical protein